MKKIVLIILGLIAIIALSYGCFFMKKDQIKEDLLLKAQSTYKINGMNWVHPTIQGENLEVTRILQLNGNAPSQEAKDEAEKIASTIEGLSGIDNKISVPVKVRETIQNGSIEELADKITEQETQIEPKNIASSEINLQNDLNNKIISDRGIEDKIKIEEEPTKEMTIPSPYTFSAIKNENGNLLLSGLIGNQKDYDNTISLAKKLFGEDKLKDELKVANGNPKGWSEMVLLAINKLNEIDYGDIKITDSSYVFNAHVSSDKKKQAFLNDIKAKLSVPNNKYIRYQGDYIITAPVPIEENQFETNQQNNNIKIAKTEPIAKTVPMEQENIQSNISCQEDFNALLQKEKIQFKYNSATIKRKSYSLLDEIVEVAKRCRDAKIIIGGYTDSIGSRAYNKKLSKQRANKVRYYLIRKGIPRSNLRAIGYGESHPIADNFHEAGRAKNRRIEFKIEGVK